MSKRKLPLKEVSKLAALEFEPVALPKIPGVDREDWGERAEEARVCAVIASNIVIKDRKTLRQAAKNGIADDNASGGVWFETIDLLIDVAKKWKAYVALLDQATARALAAAAWVDAAQTGDATAADEVVT